MDIWNKLIWRIGFLQTSTLERCDDAAFGGREVGLGDAVSLLRCLAVNTHQWSV